MSELKPCPACGKPVELEGGQSWHDQHSFLIKCYACGCSRVADSDEDEAIHRWNALPRPLRWTKEPPTEPGWYWFRNMHTKGEIYLPQIVHTVQIKGRKPHPADEWAGPIQKPLDTAPQS